jgi:hypothetical protein
LTELIVMGKEGDEFGTVAIFIEPLGKLAGEE